MDIPFMLRGLVIGFSVAAPVGPIGVLCIRRSLAEGHASGFVSGLGAATADALYGCVAGFGLTFISNILIHQQIWIRLIGGLFLCALGVKTFLASPAKEGAPSRGRGLAGAYVSTFFLTLTNPMTIFSFAAIFAGLGIVGRERNYGSAGALVLGVFMGSGLWWLILSSAVGRLWRKIDATGLSWVNRASGAILIIFGLLALLSTVSTFGF